MNDYMTATSKASVHLQRTVCGTVFSVFCFVYLYVFQRNVMEALHYSLAQGKTSFVAFPTAVVITVVMLLVRWGGNCLMGLKGRLRALAYFPPCLLLGVLTDVGRGVYIDHDKSLLWYWLLPILLTMFFILMSWLRRAAAAWLGRTCSTVALLNSNLSILFMLCAMTVLLGNSNRTFHQELQAERMMRMKRYEHIPNIGQHRNHVSRTQTVLRAMALSHTGELGEKLFTFPQEYRSDGLFFPEDSAYTLRYTNDSIYYMLGMKPYPGEERLVFLHNICYRSTAKHTALDYYLAALLLEKRIEQFVTAFSDLCDYGDKLPKHYGEALLLYHSLYKDSIPSGIDGTTLQRYALYQNRKAGLHDIPEGANIMRKEFGDTYWWYFDYRP